MGENEDLAEYNLLITRSKAHFRVTACSSKTKSTPVRKSDRNEKYWLFCKTHKNAKYVTFCSELLLLLLQNSLPNGQLLITGQIFSYYLTANKKHCRKNDVTDVASDMMLLWILFNIYAMTRRSVVNKREHIIETYRNLENHPLAKHETTFHMRPKQFRDNCEQLFDIMCGDQTRS